MWGNTYKEVLKSLFEIDSDYVIIVDFKEDPIIDYDYLENFCYNNKYKILSKITVPKNNPQQFKNFIGKTYIGYCIKK